MNCAMKDLAKRLWSLQSAPPCLVLSEGHSCWKNLFHGQTYSLVSHHIWLKLLSIWNSIKLVFPRGSHPLNMFPNCAHMHTAISESMPRFYTTKCCIKYRSAVGVVRSVHFKPLAIPFLENMQWKDKKARSCEGVLQEKTITMFNILWHPPDKRTWPNMTEAKLECNRWSCLTLVCPTHQHNGRYREIVDRTYVRLNGSLVNVWSHPFIRRCCKM